MNKVLLTVAILFLTIILNAQNTVEQPVSNDSSWTQSFFDNFYIEIGAGTQVLFSQDVENLDWKDRFTPSFSFSLGKWFSPVIGIELKAEGYSLNGFSTTQGTYAAVSETGSLFDEDPARKEVTINPDGTYRHFIRYANFSMNVHISLMNLVSDYKNERIFDLIPSAGIGNMHVLEYKGIPKNNTLSTNFGLLGKFKVAQRLDLNIKANTAIFDNNFEGRIAGDASKDKYVSGSIGVVYYIKNRGFNKVLN